MNGMVLSFSMIRSLVLLPSYPMSAKTFLTWMPSIMIMETNHPTVLLSTYPAALLAPNCGGEPVESGPVGYRVYLDSLTPLLQVEDAQPLWIVPEEAYQPDDRLDLLEVHEKEGHEHRAGRVPLRSRPVSSVW